MLWWFKVWKVIGGWFIMVMKMVLEYLVVRFCLN